MAKAPLERKRLPSAVSATSLAALNAAQPARLSKAGDRSPHQSLNATFHSLYRLAKLSQPVNQLASDFSDYSGVVIEANADLGQNHVSEQPTGRNLIAGFQFVQMPEQPILNSSSLSDQVLTVVDQELDLTAPTLQLRHWKARLTQCCPCHRQGVDGIRLAELAA